MKQLTPLTTHPWPPLIVIHRPIQGIGSPGGLDVQCTIADAHGCMEQAVASSPGSAAGSMLFSRPVRTRVACYSSTYTCTRVLVYFAL